MTREYIICGRLPLDTQTSPPHGSPRTARRDSKRGSNLRSLYHGSPPSLSELPPLESLKEPELSEESTPILPPTPPTTDEVLPGSVHEQQVYGSEPHKAEHSDVVPLTPVRAVRPFTPDHTPPQHGRLVPDTRPFLSLKPSVASTRAESFETAHETLEYTARSPQPQEGPIPSRPTFYQETLAVDTEVSDAYASIKQNSAQDRLAAQYRTTVQPAALARHDTDSGLAASALARPSEQEEQHSKHHAESSARAKRSATPPTDMHGASTQRPISFRTLITEEVAHNLNRNTGLGSSWLESPDESQAGPKSDRAAAPAASVEPSETEPRLQERLVKDQHMDANEASGRFADIIGWNDKVSTDIHMTRPTSTRWSGLSVPSRVEAYVVDTETPQRTGTLRKVVKNDSLRSVSSPIPCRDSLHSVSPSSHRLVHKKARLSNSDRLSEDLEVSRSLSLGSSPTMARFESVPARASAEGRVLLHSNSPGKTKYSSATTIKSEALNATPTMFTPLQEPYKDRMLSSAQANHEFGEYDQGSQPFHRPSPSASSIATEHDHSLHRQQAENDLRATLDRMESERASIGLHQLSGGFSPLTAPKVNITAATPIEPLSRIASSRRSHSVTSGPDKNFDMNTVIPGTSEWYELRPDNPDTPHTQRSGLSASPEISQATAVNFFPHNNGSVQLIEPFKLSESSILRTSRLEPHAQSDITLPSTLSRPTGLPVNRHGAPVSSDAVDWATSKIDDSNLPGLHADIIDSPYRNPREAPKPPAVNAALPPFSTSLMQSAQTGLPARPTSALPGDSFPGNTSGAPNFSMRNVKSSRREQDSDGLPHLPWRSEAVRNEDNSERYESYPDAAGHGRRIEDDGGNGPSRRSLPFGAFPRRARSEATEPTWLTRRLSRRSQKHSGFPLECTPAGSQEHEGTGMIQPESASIAESSSKQRSSQRSPSRKYTRALDKLGLHRSITTDRGTSGLHSLRPRFLSINSRREQKEEVEREQRRLRLKNSIGNDIISQSDSRFPIDSDTEPIVASDVGAYNKDAAVHNNNSLEQSALLTAYDSQRPESDDSWTTAQEIGVPNKTITSSSNASQSLATMTSTNTPLATDDAQLRKRQRKKRKDRYLAGPGSTPDNPYIASSLDPRVDGGARQVAPPTANYRDITHEYKAELGRPALANGSNQQDASVNGGVDELTAAHRASPRAFSFDYQSRSHNGAGASVASSYDRPSSTGFRVMADKGAAIMSRFASLRRMSQSRRSASETRSRPRPVSWASTLSSASSTLNRVPYIGSLSRSSSMARYAADDPAVQPGAGLPAKNTILRLPTLKKSTRDADTISEREKDPQRTIWPAFAVGEEHSIQSRAEDSSAERKLGDDHSTVSHRSYIGSINRIDSISRYKARHDRMPPSSYTYRENATPRRSRSDRVRSSENGI